MDIKGAQAILENLIYVIEHSVSLNEEHALLVMTEVFRAIMEQGRAFVHALLEYLLEGLLDM